MFPGAKQPNSPQKQKKITIAPMPNVVNQWVFVGLSNKSYEGWLKSRCITDQLTAPRWRLSKDANREFSAQLPGSLAVQRSLLSAVFLIELHTKQMITYFYTANEGPSWIFHVSTQTFDLLLTQGSWTFSSLLQRLFNPWKTEIQHYLTFPWPWSTFSSSDRML